MYTPLRQNSGGYRYGMRPLLAGQHTTDSNMPTPENGGITSLSGETGLGPLGALRPGWETIRSDFTTVGVLVVVS